MSTQPVSGHQHLDEDSAEAAAHHYLRSGELPDCAVCGREVQALARYFSAGQLLGQRRSDIPGTPAANAIRELRRRSYPRRALGALGAMLTPAGGNGR